MLWAVAWEQTPCGSLPDDDEAIAGKLDMPLKQFKAAREKLMRGWWPADDGRLYHATLTERVREMIEYRNKEAARRAANRGKPSPNTASPVFVPRDNSVTPVAVPRDDIVSLDTGTGTGTSSSTPSAPKKRRAAAADAPAGIDPQVWGDWLAVRKAKRAGPVTPTVVQALERQAALGGMSAEDAVRACVECGWQNFNAQWYAERTAKRGSSVVPINRQEAVEQRNRAAGDEWLRQQETRDAVQ
jgi:hypothetical protein